MLTEPAQFLAADGYMFISFEYDVPQRYELYVHKLLPTPGGKRTSGQYLYEHTVPTTWQISTSDKRHVQYSSPGDAP